MTPAAPAVSVKLKIGPLSYTCSVAKGCRLMRLPRSTYYDAPPVKADDAEIVAAITAICGPGAGSLVCRSRRVVTTLFVLSKIYAEKVPVSCLRCVPGQV
jgi:hypothetical protein